MSLKIKRLLKVFRYLPDYLFGIRNPIEVFLGLIGLKEKCDIKLSNNITINDVYLKNNYRLISHFIKLIKLKELGINIKILKNVIYINNLKVPREKLGVVSSYLDLLAGGGDLYKDEEGYPLVSLYFNGEKVRFRLPESYIGAYELVEVFKEQCYGYFDYKGKTVIDIGAFIGDTSIYFSLAGAKKIFAFEPNPKLFKILAYNLSLNHIKNVESFNAGTLNKSGFIKFYILPNRLGSSSLYHKNYLKNENIEYLNVEIKDISEILNRIGQIDIMKIDCEGCEYEVIKKLIDTDQIYDIKEGIILEVHTVQDYKPEDMVVLLQKIFEKVTVIKKEKFTWLIKAEAL